MKAKLKGKLRAFGETCPKCKAATSIRTHCARCKQVPRVEHLHCVCTQCGYAWAQETADAGKRGKR